MNRLITIIAILIMAGSVLADDTLGVTNRTGFSSNGLATMEGTHLVGWRNNGVDTIYVWHTNSEDTMLQWAYIGDTSLGTGGACTTRVSIYDSTTGTLRAYSDLIITGSRAVGYYLDSAAITGYLSPNTAYKIGVQSRNDSVTTYNRTFIIYVPVWGHIYRLNNQGFTAPANLSGHSANNEGLIFAYVTLEPGEGGGTWSCSQAVSFADTADTSVIVTDDFTLENATVTRLIRDWGYTPAMTETPDTILAPSDPVNDTIYCDEHDSVWFQYRAEDDDSGKADTSEVLVVQTFYTITHSLSIYNLSYNSFGVIDNYTANTVTEMNLYISLSNDIAGAFLAQTKSSGFGSPDSLDEPEDTLTAGGKYYFWVEIIDNEMGSDTSSIDSVTLYTIISLDSIIVADTNSTSITLLTWLSDYNTGDDSLFTYVSADSDSVAGFEAAVCRDTALVNASDSVSNSISGLIASTEYFYIQIVIDSSTGLADTSVIASITTAAGGTCDMSEVEPYLDAQTSNLTVIINAGRDSVITAAKAYMDSVVAAGQAYQDSIIKAGLVYQDSINAYNQILFDSLFAILAAKPDTDEIIVTLPESLFVKLDAKPDTNDLITSQDTVNAFACGGAVDTARNAGNADTSTIKTMMTNNAWGWTYGTRALTDKAGFSITGTITTFDGLNTGLSSTHGASSWATAIGFAVPGSAMTLTPGERAAIEDTMALHAATYKADVSNLDIALSTARDAIMAAMRDSTAKAFSDSGFTVVRAGKLDSLDHLDQDVSEGATDSLGIDGVLAARIPDIAKAASDSTLRDSLSYQGSASSITAEEIADAVTDSLGLGIGAGDYACSLYVLNSNDTTAIQNAWVTTFSADHGTKYTRWYSNTSGLIIFKLDAEDSVIYEAAKPGVAFTLPEYISITEDQTDTIWGNVLTPAAAYGSMVALQFYQLTPSYDTLSATSVKYMLVADSAGTEYDIDDRLTFGIGTSTITLSKKEQTKQAAFGDTSYVTFSVFSNYDIYINGVADSSSYYQFIIQWQDGEETRIWKQIDDITPQNPMAP